MSAATLLDTGPPAKAFPRLPATGDAEKPLMPETTPATQE
jgi:hypothetical protein